MLRRVLQANWLAECFSHRRPADSDEKLSSLHHSHAIEIESTVSYACRDFKFRRTKVTKVFREVKCRYEHHGQLRGIGVRFTEERRIVRSEVHSR